MEYKPQRAMRGGESARDFADRVNTLLNRNGVSSKRASAFLCERRVMLSYESEGKYEVVYVDEMSAAELAQLLGSIAGKHEFYECSECGAFVTAFAESTLCGSCVRDIMVSQ